MFFQARTVYVLRYGSGTLSFVPFFVIFFNKNQTNHYNLILYYLQQEEYEARFANMPAWKRQMIERKEAQAK